MSVIMVTLLGFYYRMFFFFFFKQKTAYELLRSLVGSEMCIRDSPRMAPIYVAEEDFRSTMLLGVVVGFAAGYRGGVVDEVLNMLTNIVLVIPTLAVLLIIAAYLEVRGILVEAVFIGFTAWPWAARAVRAQTFSLVNRDFVDLARLSGVKAGKIILNEIAPNMMSYLLLVFILEFGGAILNAATLDFIGLGPTEGMSLGLMMNNAVMWGALLLGQWWWFVPPGAAITAIVGALYVMNVGLNEVFNPKLRGM